MAPLAIFAVIVIILLLSGLPHCTGVPARCRISPRAYVGLRGPGLYWFIPLAIERAVTSHSDPDRIGRTARDDHPRQRHGQAQRSLVVPGLDAAKSVIAVADAPAAVYQLALTSLRNSIGQHDLDEVLQKRDKINELLRQNIAGSTEAWGVEVERFEMKDVELPAAMQEVMAMQAQAIRKTRAHHQGRSGARGIEENWPMPRSRWPNNPVAVELRRMQMVTEVGAENNSTTAPMIPSDFVSLAKSVSEYVREQHAKKICQARIDGYRSSLPFRGGAPRERSERFRPERALATGSRSTYRISRLTRLNSMTQFVSHVLPSSKE